MIWNKLDGYKTYIGAVLLALSALAPLAGLSPEVAEAIKQLAEAVIAGGLGHKLTKLGNHNG